MKNNTLMNLAISQKNKHLQTFLSKFSNSQTIMNDIFFKYKDVVNKYIISFRNELSKEERQKIWEKGTLRLHDVSFKRPFEEFFESITHLIAYTFERFNTYNSDTKTWHFNENQAQLLPYDSYAINTMLNALISKTNDEWFIRELTNIHNYYRSKFDNLRKYDDYWLEFILNDSYLANLLFVVYAQEAIFAYIIDDGSDHVRYYGYRSKESNRTVENDSERFNLFKKCLNAGLINACAQSFDYNYGTIFHVAAKCNYIRVFGLLLEKLDKNCNKYLDWSKRTPLQVATKHGNWMIVKQILMSKMGNKMKEKAKNDETMIKSQYGIVNQFLKRRKAIRMNRMNKMNNNNDNNDNKDNNNNDSKNDILMEEMVITMIDLIETQCAISDDMLLLTFKYETEQCNKIESKHRIWNVIKKVMAQVLDSNNKHKNWNWFHIYLLKSRV